MKKFVFFMTPVVALILSGCIGAGCSPVTSGSSSYALTNTKTPEVVYGHDIRGIRFFLSPRSSVNIDVECILEYVQGDAVFSAEYQREESMIPWIRFNYAY